MQDLSPPGHESPLAAGMELRSKSSAAGPDR